MKFFENFEKIIMWLDSNKKVTLESQLHEDSIRLVPKFQNAILSYMEVLDFDFDPKNRFRVVNLATGEVFMQK